MVVKIHFFMRTSKTFSLMTTLILTCVVQIIPFLVFLFLWIVWMALLYYVLGSNFSTNAEGYTNLPVMMGMIFYTFENSIGNIQPPTFDYW